MHPKSPMFARQKYCKIASLGKGTVCGHDTEFSLNEDSGPHRHISIVLHMLENKLLLGSGRHKVVEKREKGPILLSFSLKVCRK